MPADRLRVAADELSAAWAAIPAALQEAIRTAIQSAGARDIVLVAGKGHEDYQEVHGVRRPFSDVGEARAALLERAGL